MKILCMYVIVYASIFFDFHWSSSIFIAYASLRMLEIYLQKYWVFYTLNAKLMQIPSKPVHFFSFTKRKSLRIQGKYFSFYPKHCFGSCDIRIWYSSFLSNILRFKQKVEVRIIMTSWNGLHKVPIVIFAKTWIDLFELKHKKCPGDG